MKRIIIQAIVAMVVLAVGFAGFKILSGFKEEQKKHNRPPVVKTVKVLVAEKKDLLPEIKALGQVRSEQPVQLGSEVSGAVMSSGFKLKSGTHFKKGQILVKVDTRRAALNFKSAVSNLLNAMANVLPEIKADIPDQFEKWNVFFSKTSFEKLPELPEVKEQKEKLYISRFNVYNLYFAARNMQITLEKHYIKAPFTGTVVNSGIRPGSTIGMGSPLGTIVRTDKMEIEVPLSAVDAEWIDPKGTVSFTIAESGRIYKGKVDRVAKAMAGGNQTISAYIAVDKTSARSLIDGMYADVLFIGKKVKNSISIPRKAVIGKDMVYLVSESRLFSKKVTIPRFGIDKVYLTEGIKNGDTVVVESIQDAIENMTVRTFVKDKQGAWTKTWKDEKRKEGTKGNGGHH